MDNVIIIPARIGSQRIKDKPLVNILGQSAIRWTVQNALESNKKVVVCSDDKSILDSLKGFDVIKNLNGKKYNNGTECALDFGITLNPETITVLNCGEIGVKQTLFDDIFKQVYSGKFDISTCVQKISGFEIADTNTIKVVCSSKKEIIYLSRAPIPFPKKTDNINNCVFLKNIGISCYTFNAAKRYLSSTISDAENIEEIDLIRCLDDKLKIGVVEIKDKPPSLICSKDLNQLEDFLKVDRIKNKKPLIIPNIH